MIRPLACLYISPLVSTIVQLKKIIALSYSIFSSYIMKIQYSTSGLLFGIVYRVGKVLQTNILEKF